MADIATDAGEPQDPPEDAPEQPATPSHPQLSDDDFSAYGDNGDGTWTLRSKGGGFITLHDDPEKYGLHPPSRAKITSSVDSEEPGSVMDAIKGGFEDIKSRFGLGPAPTASTAETPATPAPPATAQTPPPTNGKAPPPLKVYQGGAGTGLDWRHQLAAMIAGASPTPPAGAMAEAAPPADVVPGAVPSPAGPVSPAVQLAVAKAKQMYPELTPEQAQGVATLAAQATAPSPPVAPEDAANAWAVQNLDNAGAPVVPPGVTPPTETPAPLVQVPPTQGALSPEQQAAMTSALATGQPPTPAPPVVPAAAPVVPGAVPPISINPAATVGHMATAAAPGSPFQAPAEAAKAAVDQQAAAQQAQNDALAKVASETTAQIGSLNSQFTKDAGADVENAANRLAKYDTLSAAADAAKNFDANKFWNTRSAGQMLALSVGSAFGSFAKTLGGTDTASEILNKGIDNAARGEEMKLQSQWKSAESAAKGLDMQKEVSALRMGNFLTTKANVIDLAKQRIDEETLKTNNPLIIAKAATMKAGLDRELANDSMRYAELRNTLANSATQRGLTQQQTIAAKLGNAGEAAVLPSKVDVELGQLGATKDQQDFARIGGYDSDPVKKQAAEQVWLKDHPAIPALLPGQNLDAMQKIVEIEKSKQEMEQNAQDRALPGGGSAPVAQAKVATGIDTGIRSVAPLLKDLDTLSDSDSIGPAGRLTGPVSTEAQTQFGAKAQAIATQLISALGETARENPQLWQSLSPQIPLATDRADTIKTKTRALRQILQDAAHGAGSKVDYFPELKVHPKVRPKVRPVVK